MPRKRVSISLGTIFSLIVIYFIYLFARDQSGSGWRILAFITKWYLIIVVGLFLLGIIVAFIIFLIILAFFLYAKFSHRREKRKTGFKKFFDAKFKVKKPKKKPRFEW